MKTLEDEWYVVIKAYKLAVFEILGDFFVLPYIACACYPYIRVYRLYDYLDKGMLQLGLWLGWLLICLHYHFPVASGAQYKSDSVIALQTQHY